MTVEQLKEYIKRAIDLESALYTQNQAIYQIDKQLSSYGIKKNFSVKAQEKAEVDSSSVPFIIFGALILAMGICSIGACADCECAGFTIIGILIALLGFGLIVIGVKDFRDTKALKRQYHDEYLDGLKDVQSSMREDSQRVEKEKMMIPRIQEQRKLLYDKYWETKKVLDSLYEYDIIFSKYRNIVALCTFYEYLMSGRCSTLEGHEGAYNIYENEIRLNMIIIKLDEVVANLESIQQNQYMLYDAIKENNRKVDTLISNVKELTSSVNYAADQTAIAAQNTRWAAEELNTIKWLEILKS